MERWRKGGHHIGFGFGLLAVLFFLFVLYRILVNSGVMNKFTEAMQPFGHYHLIVHLPEGKVQEFDVFGKVTVEDNHIKISTHNETYYYQVPPTTIVEVKRLEE